MAKLLNSTLAMSLSTAAAVLILTPPLAAQDSATPSPPSARVTFDGEGVVEATTVAIPQSAYLSEEAKAHAIRALSAPYPSFEGDIEKVRKAYDEVIILPSLNAWREIYPVEIERTKMGQVPVHIVTPKAGVAEENKERVLIAVHGGAFMIGGNYGAQATAVPVAGRGQVKVVSVDYRMAPEHRFPAASDDVVTVYKELLKSHDPKNIGIYGCSAGGAITAQAVASLQAEGAPRPGAIGILCAGAGIDFGRGDGAYFGSILSGQAPPPVETPSRDKTPFIYFAGADLSSPLVSPVDSPELLAQFPPTLLVTGTRDVAMSASLITHDRLLAAGVETTLYVQEGMGHNHFNMFAGTEESKAAYDVIWRFFDKYLSRP